MAERENSYTAFVDPRYTEIERNELGIAIINYIVNRTKDGRGIGNKPFKSKYSDNYTKTADFKIAGKTQKEVNLTLSGDMLDSIEVIDATVVGRIKIGFVTEFENDKSVWVQERGYKFLGLTDDELKRIINQYGPPENDTRPAEISSEFVESFVRGIFGR